jgi:hypothetical protein
MLKEKDILSPCCDARLEKTSSGFFCVCMECGVAWSIGFAQKLHEDKINKKYIELVRRLEELEKKIKTSENYVVQKDNRNELKLLIKEQIAIHNLKDTHITEELLLHNIMGLVDEYVRRLKESEK